jgi:hypothetical protein
MEKLAYEAPAILDTFEPNEVLGAAEGQQCGNGSQLSIIGIPS